MPDDSETAHRATVVIPNWNGVAFLGECLDALASQSAGPPAVIVVDNGSADGSVEFIRENHPGVRVIENPVNEGFGRAVNKGIAAADTEFVALLNNDAVPDPGWIGTLVAALDEYPGFDSCACKIVFHDKPDEIDSAGDAYTPWGMVSNRGHGEPDDGRLDTPGPVFGPCAAAALYRRSLFDDVGLFDENMFAYYEDTDLSLRAALAGHKCLYVPAARVRHHYSASSAGRTSKLGSEEVYIHLTGVLLKNMPAAVILRHLPSVLLVHSAVVLFSILARIRRAHRLPRVPFFRFIRAMLAQRPGIRAKTRISIPELYDLFSHRSFLHHILDRKKQSAFLISAGENLKNADNTRHTRRRRRNIL